MAKTVFIPRSGKTLRTLDLSHLHPAWASSWNLWCSTHSTNTWANTTYFRMFGFRQGLATQELLLQLQHEIIEGRGCSPRDTSAVLGLDLSKAFNIATHSAILESYMRNWMWPKIPTTTLGISSRRKQPASLIADLKSNPHATQRTGLASRLILSPTLFNVALRLANWTKYWDWGTAGTPTWHYGYPEVVMETLKKAIQLGIQSLFTHSLQVQEEPCIFTGLVARWMK